MAIITRGYTIIYTIYPNKSHDITIKCHPRPHPMPQVDVVSFATKAEASVKASWVLAVEALNGLQVVKIETGREISRSNGGLNGGFVGEIIYKLSINYLSTIYKLSINSDLSLNEGDSAG